METITTVEHAALIRRTLKAKYGITSKQVSVRSDCYSMGSSIQITIKDPTIRKADVEAVARSHERVDYDAASGEILSGGNRFVDVTYSGEAIAPLASQVLAILQTLTEPGQGVDWHNWRLSRPRNAPHYAAWQAEHPHASRTVSCHGMEHCARQVAELTLEGGLAGSYEPLMVSVRVERGAS